jgi:hypothetical protein
VVEKEYVEEVMRVMAREKEALSQALVKIVEEDVVFSPISESETPGLTPVDGNGERVVGVLEKVELKEQGGEESEMGLKVVEVKES